jgi:Pectate lyase superfamily protein
VLKLNAPQVWWIQGDQVESATPGGWIRLFGLNLGLKKGAKVILRNDGISAPLRLIAVDDFNFQAEVPAGIALGRYKVEFQNGESADAGEIELVKPPVQKTREYRVTDFGAVSGQPDAIQYYTGMKAADQVDSTASIQKALNAAGKDGGGVVYFPRGIYVLSKGLEVPAGVILRGAGRGQTALSWVDDQLPREKEDIVKLMWGSLLFKPIPDPKNSPHPYLIRGSGHFGVEDLAIYAVNHRAGILSDFPDTAAGAGHVKIHRVLMRLNRFINVQRTGRHYADAEEAFLRRWKDEPKGGANSQGAIHLSGPNLEVVDCDIYSSMSAMIFNGASGVIARNRIGGDGPEDQKVDL